MISEMLEQIIGTYEPVIHEGVPVMGVAGLDIVWIASFSLIAIALYSVFRVFGTFIGGKR